ncbi:MAG TPA: hypothetical protein VHA33_26890 [Candidatus Angelobacter sp.]|nr:hypothetical protein [Candidatus Angelobacter sp.]
MKVLAHTRALHPAAPAYEGKHDLHKGQSVIGEPAPQTQPE